MVCLFAAKQISMHQFKREGQVFPDARTCTVGTLLRCYYLN